MVQNKKILFVVESLKIGGAEKALISILKLIDYNRYDINLLIISKTGELQGELAKLTNLKIKYLTCDSKSLAKKIINRFKIKAVYGIIPSQLVGNYICKEADIVIAFTEGFLTKWIASTNRKCKKIAWVHTDMINNDWPYETKIFKSYKEEEDAYQKFDEIVGVSESVSEGIRTKFNCINVTTIYNILDPDLMDKVDREIVNKRNGEINIVSVGRLEYVKGYDLLIGAMSVLHKNHVKNATLTIVGDGSQKEELTKIIQKYGLSHIIRLVGFQSNPYPFIKAGDLFVCPSRKEGFNIAILEAMALGKPIVSTNSAGPKEILHNGEYGILTEIDITSLAEGIAIMLERNNLKKYSVKSIQRATDFSSNLQLAKLEHILK